MVCTQVDGYGPILFRALSKRDMEEIEREQCGSLHLGVALLIQRAIVSPRPEDMADLGDEAIDAIATAIIEGSWPN